MRNFATLALLCLLALAPAAAQSPSNMMSPVGPAPIEIVQGDVLVLNATQISGTPAGAVSVQYFVTYRMKLTDGTIKTFPNGPLNLTTGTPVPVTWPLPSGWLLSVTVGQQNGVQRGFILTQVFVGKLVQPIYNYIDYCLISTTMAGFQTVTWPMHPPQQDTDGQGALISYTVSNPAAGANWTTTFTSGVRNRITAVRFQLVTSATAGTRQVCVKFTDAGANVFTSKCVQATQAASQIVTYNFAVAVGSDFTGAAALTAIPSGNTQATANDVMVALPYGLAFNDATVVASSVIGLLAGDQLQSIVVRTESWNEID